MTARCTAHRKNGEPCKRPPIRGGTVCASHGGSAPAVRAAAERRLTDQRARSLAQELAAQQQPMHIGDVYTELLDLATVVVAWRKLLQERLDGHEDTGEPVTDRSDVILFERALDRSQRVLVDIARLDLDTRMARINEHIAGQVVGLIRRTLARLDLTDDQRAAADVIIPEELRRLDKEPER